MCHDQAKYSMRNQIQVCFKHFTWSTSRYFDNWANEVSFDVIENADQLEIDCKMCDILP